MFKLNANKSKLVPGPVRRIGVQSRSITGTMPNGSRYESSLERDLMLLLDFDFHVDLYTPQPVTILYRNKFGQQRRYTPDGLIEYRKDLPLFDPRPMLVEVKYRADFAGQAKTALPKFRAATQYAEERGWRFAVLTETEIRTPVLDNVRFLQRFRNRPINVDIDVWVLETLQAKGTSTPGDLVTSLYQDKWNQATLIPVIWRLIAQHHIGCDLSQLLTMTSEIWATAE